MDRRLLSTLRGLGLAVIAGLAGCGGSSSAPAPASAPPPAITTQPAAQNVVAPAAATFSVLATGAQAYQWRRDSTDIPGATQSSYTTPATVPSDNGVTFSVSVSNGSGSVLSSAATLSVTAPSPGALSNESLLHDSMLRGFLKYTPQDLPLTPVPLVIVLHGGSQDAAVTSSPARGTYGWRPLADLEKFVLVYPDGVDRKWHDCRSDNPNLGAADDVGFIDALITQLSNERAIDLARVYVSGVSNGGLMSYRIAQELPHRIAGIGAVIANVAADPLQVCPSARAPIAVVIMNGTADTLMPYDGGIVGLNSEGGRVTSASASRDYWATVNGCSGSPVTEALSDLDPTDGSTVSRQSYATCSSGKPVVLFRVDGGGHTMPSLAYFTAGQLNRDIEGADEIWRVLKHVRL